MFQYYVRLGTKSIMRQPVLSLLMMLAVGLGIGVSMTMFSLYYTLSMDPIPEKSSQLYAVRIDSWDAEQPADDDNPEQPPTQLTWNDGQALLNSDVPVRQTVMMKSFFSLNMPDPEINPFMVTSRMSTKDFFALFNLPFLYGSGWDAGADQNAERVVVISKETNDKVFGGGDSVGKQINLDAHSFTVIGVLDHWDPSIRYYDMNNGAIGRHEDVFMPISLVPEIEAYSGGNTNCWKDEEIVGHAGLLASECVMVQFWAELDSKKMKNEYLAWLDGYVEEQKALGRHPRAINNRVDNVVDWLEINKVVPDDLRVMVGLAFLFLAVCLFNAVGLLLARFLSKTPTVALRRAVGASKRSIIFQHLIEVGLIGLGGALFGIIFAVFGLMGVNQLMSDLDRIATFSWSLTAIAIGISVVSTLIAGLYPTWRICRTSPSTQLKTQ